MSNKKKKQYNYLEYIPNIFDIQNLTDFPFSYSNGKLGHDIPDRNQLIFREDHGFCFGVKRELGRDYFVGKRQTGDGHILCIGSPGSGKTTGPVIMSMGTWGGGIIALDIKGEDGDLVNPWYDLNRSMGSMKKHLKVFNPTKEYSSCYDPYTLLRCDGEENLIHNARDLALAILPTPPRISENKVWIKLAQNLLTGSILYYYDLGADFNSTMVAVQNKSVPDLVKTIMGSNNEEVKFEMTQSRNMSAEMFISKIQGLKPEIMAGIGMDFGEFVALAVDPLIKSAFSTEGKKDIIDWNDFNANEKVYDVIMQIPENKLEQWEPMITLMLNQLTKTLERRADKHSSYGKTLRPVLVLLDEFPRLGTCHAIKNGLSTLRSRGVTFALFVQNLAQLDERYGTNGRRNILGCCSYKMLLSVTEPDDQEYFSRLIGTTKTGQRSVSANFSPNGEILGYSVSINEVKECIVKPEELGTLENYFILLTPRGFCRVDKASFYDQRYRELLIPPRNMAALEFHYNP